MRKYDHVLFDLDGTMTDTCSGITRSVQYALRHFGIEAETDSLKKFIGPPLMDSFMKFYGFDEKRAAEAVIKYREFYSVDGLFDNRLYDGIPQMLEKVHKVGSEIILATSKPLVFAEHILDNLGINRFFDYRFGADLPGYRTKKVDIIAYALQEHPIDISRAIMVGDRDVDILGAHANGMKAIGVLYGFGDAAELNGCGADALAETVLDLEALLLD